MVDSSIILVLISLIVFAFSILMLTRVCECAKRRPTTERPSTTEQSNEERIFIVEENGDILVVNNNGEGSIDKYDVKHSYQNLAPPPYFALVNVLVEASYELPPPYPIDVQ
ncbi:hypothetical protein NQ317_001340 [Molorchus minor]|uniref:Uncharacterized protein n=1 Tax=Molorchus minor TaxID=1323400 RepID=A0ABQ9JNR5_9CUCU|nr:hypothetical protein NQ317_001340 [Molorchus minor]